jgi:hypothetical protein
MGFLGFWPEARALTQGAGFLGFWPKARALAGRPG